MSWKHITKYQIPQKLPHIKQNNHITYEENTYLKETLNKILMQSRRKANQISQNVN